LIKHIFLLAAILWAAFPARTQPTQVLQLVQTITMPAVPVGPYTDHLAVDLKHRRLFATPQAHKSVYVFDLDTGKLIHDIPGMVNPHSILYRDDLDRIYVTDGGAGLLKVFSGRDCQLLSSVELLLDVDSIAYDPASKYLYITNGGEGAKLSYSQVSVVDTTKSEHIGDIRIRAETLEAMALDPSSSRIYINITDKNAIGILDREKRTLLAMWPITKGQKNMAVALDEAHHRLFVGCRNTETHGVIVVFDTGTGKELQTLPIDGWVDYIAFDPRTKRIYASCGSGSGSAYVIEESSPDKYELLQKVTTAPMAKTALFVPELNRLFVSAPHKDQSEAKIMVFAVR
jgi:DNA-binding beta-propeller fold protein YncE